MTKSLRIILERIALENHTTPDAVCREIQNAIDAGFENPDPHVRAFWKQLDYKGDRPTPEEVVLGIGHMLKKENGASPRK